MSRRKQKLTGDVASFLRQYQRKRKNTPDPNDRGYDRELEKKLQRMKPEDVAELMFGEENAAESGHQDETDTRGIA
jgi:hypothetical protein